MSNKWNLMLSKLDLLRIQVDSTVCTLLKECREILIMVAHCFFPLFHHTRLLKSHLQRPPPHASSRLARTYISEIRPGTEQIQNGIRLQRYCQKVGMERGQERGGFIKFNVPKPLCYI